MVPSVGYFSNLAATNVQARMASPSSARMFWQSERTCLTTRNNHENMRSYREIEHRFSSLRRSSGPSTAWVIAVNDQLMNTRETGTDTHRKDVTNMEAVVINAIIGFWLVLFGAMAIFPFVIESKPSRRTPIEIADDQIISIQPVAMPQSTRHAPTPLAIPTATPDHREAA